MGNLVATIYWDPHPQDFEILRDLRKLTKECSLSESDMPAYKKDKTLFAAENAGWWRLVISDNQVDLFSKQAISILKNYEVKNFGFKKENLPM